jgi:hypothetical protein
MLLLIHDGVGAVEEPIQLLRAASKLQLPLM